MPDVQGVRGGLPPDRFQISQPPERRSASQRQHSGDGADRVDLSASARRIADEAGTMEIRLDKVMAVRDAIAQGTYETPEKIEAAVDRMLDDVLTK